MDKDALIERLMIFFNDVLRLCAMNKRKSRHSTAQKLRLLYEGGEKTKGKVERGKERTESLLSLSPFALRL